MATDSLSDFQENKIKHVFTLLYDRNGDGEITLNDFEVSIEEIRTLLDWKKGSAEHEKAKKTLTGIWEGLQIYADKNKDGIVTETEWLNMWKDCIRDINKGEEFPDWQKEFIELMFKVNDTSGDGEIDLKEYTRVYRHYGVSDDDCTKAFTEIAGESRNTINLEAFKKLWEDYFVKDDASSKANYLFGVPDFMKS